MLESSKDNIKISVIVPVYNIQEYIERCIESIINQTHKNLEVLIIDDGSKDNSKAIIEKLARQDERIIPIYKVNGGVTSARLTGVKEATGEYIGFVDGDDEIEADMYEKLLENALRYRADISHCGYQKIFLDGSVKYYYQSKKIVEQDYEKGIKDLLEGKFIEPGLWNKLYKRTLFEDILENNIMDTSIRINEDLLMNYYLFSMSRKSIFQDVCKYHYMEREQSASAGVNQNRIYDPIRVKEYIMQSANPRVKPYAEKAYIETCINVYNGLIRYGDEYQNEKNSIKQKLKEKKKLLKVVKMKRKCIAILILHFSYLYDMLYRLHRRVLR